jgi:hypothetical protein
MLANTYKKPITLQSKHRNDSTPQPTAPNKPHCPFLWSEAQHLLSQPFNFYSFFTFTEKPSDAGTTMPQRAISSTAQ